MDQAEEEEEESEQGGAGANATSTLASGGTGVLTRRSITARVGGQGGEGAGSGNGGAAGATESGIVAWASAATAGQLGIGGNGSGYDGASGSPFVFGGGGGGGGYYGGGGAGSSFIDEADGATGTVVSGAAREQAVTLNYTIASPPKATIGSPALGGGAYTQGAVVDTEFSCEDGSGGSGIESCVDSGGASAGAGTLDTSTVGAHSYTVTAKSKDGLTATATIEYTVSAPVAQVASTPSAPDAPSEPAAAATPAAAPPRTCSSAREIAFHLAKHLALPGAERIVRATVLLAGRLVARLTGPDPVAHLSLVGLPKGAYAVTFFARTSRGRLLSASAVFHTCAPRRAAT
jgi:hypothetical protein